MSSFIQYSDILLDGFSSNPKSYDLINKKRDLIEDVLDHYGLPNTDILFVGFSPWCLALDRTPFTITNVSEQVVKYLESQDCKFTHVSTEDLVKSKKKHSVVVAADEYFTFANSDQGQRELVDELSRVTKDLIITTLRDYKNQDFKDREFSQPIMIRGVDSNKIFLEHYDYDIKDKNASTSKIHVVADNHSKMFGPFARRNMYFKQLAKFSLDAGASNFYVHKNLMYKSVIKKNYEHVITIKF